MKSLGKKLLKLVAAAGICGLSLASVALASPPTSREGMTRVSGESYASRPSSSIRSAPGHVDSARLDLRAPTNVPGPSGAASSSPAFPSARHIQGSANYQDQLPVLGADAPEVRTMSQFEEFARRVHREGIPVARLWESHTALLSLGLNQRGKPGLWIIQKVK
ncbi:MAG TPA: hypothetical protein VN812_05040 [Candidatus Acidoferrales bacterium]|nr:hypothetical protein [Candidatus Acidoferrales bacterium]